MTSITQIKASAKRLIQDPGVANFTITSSNLADSGLVAYEIFEPS